MFVRMSSVKVVVWDLDGTIVDTEGPLVEAARDVLRLYGKELPSEAELYLHGRRTLDGYTYLVQTLKIPDTPEKLIEQSQKFLHERCLKAPLMPGAMRLLQYFKHHEIPMALATGTARENIPIKLNGHPFVLDFFRQIVGGDEVKEGKPDPEIFLLAAERMNVSPSECLVFEDSTAGAKAAKRAGMHVVFVPSMHGDQQLMEGTMDSHNSTEVLKSLMDFNPETHNLPAFSDKMHGVVNMNPLIHLEGTVVKGFGRGARELGIRTANIDEASLSDELSTAVTGIYAGWASVGTSSCVYKMVMSIGWNPFYKNEKKTAEAWLLHEFPEDFYGEKLRLLVVGYLRPERDFTTLENLIQQIQQDAKIAKVFLDDYLSLREDPRLIPSPSQ